ncbi:diacylglycerol/lipid kinase family protein [Actinomyces culturomici]|uniref:diacylglycerol/lipid kinase family protein n=1 Tax=Actinomyces culturomici TaxID=1926276 RepID=UPI000E204B96|nr:diacylglycerol kinase family protein [Actinomyces culturomici]
MSAPARRVARSIRLLVSSMSAGGRSVSVGPSVVRALRAGGWAVEVTVTTSSDDPMAFAASATEDVVAALGGDGFLSAVARGCHESGALFAPIPGGRGNDLCRALGIGPDPIARARTLADLGFREDEADAELAARTRPLDGMWVESDEGRRRSLVLGVVSLGLDARANVLANESFLTSGPLAYGYGAFAALASYRPTAIRARVDGVERDLTGWLASISNSGRIGGGIRLVPTSDLHDGRIELCHVGPIPLRKALPVLTKVVAGRSDGHDVIEVEEVRDVEVLEPRGLIAMADGDRVAEVPFTAHCAPGVVEVLI